MPARPQAESERQGCPQGGIAEVVARSGDRPTKGYFPVPGIRHLEGGVLDLVTDTLRAQSAKDRALYRPETLDRLFADPNGTRTTLDSNELWQLAVLEMWLQAMEDITPR